MNAEKKTSDLEILEKIKQHRNQKNLSQAQVAAVIGISQAAYAKIESGITENISLFIAKGIAKALNESFNELFDINSDSKNSEIQTDEIEDLKKKNKELTARIEEKDILIKSITNQHKHTKVVLIAEICLFFTRKREEIQEKLKNTSDEEKRKELTEELEFVQKQEKRRYKTFVMHGIVDQSDVDETFELIKETGGL